MHSKIKWGRREGEGKTLFSSPREGEGLIFFRRGRGKKKGKGNGGGEGKTLFSSPREGEGLFFFRRGREKKEGESLIFFPRGREGKKWKERGREGLIFFPVNLYHTFSLLLLP